MIKKDLIKKFIDELYTTPSKKNYETNKISYNHINEIWIIDLVVMIEFKDSNNKGYRYIFIIIDIYSTYWWCIPQKKKSKTKTQEISSILTKSKRSTHKSESDRGSEW